MAPRETHKYDMQIVTVTNAQELKIHLHLQQM